MPVTIGNTNIESNTGVLTVSGTGSLIVPVGTTAQRPSSPVNGMVRYNTTEGEYEVFRGGVWRLLSTFERYTVEYLVIGGGSGGGFRFYGGGGGAGGYRTNVPGQTSGRNTVAESTFIVSQGVPYAVTVGAGGAGNSGVGTDSAFSSIVSLAGGFGGSGANGGDGGSGGGGAAGSGGGAGTAGQGFDGNVAGGHGGGGGGAGAQGAIGSVSGGNGLSSNITGSAITRAGGGGGSMNANFSYFIGAGGTGGGGNAAADFLGPAVQATPGVANTGSGGGGACWHNTPNGAAGGSGIVIVRYAGAPRASGGSVTQSGGFTIHTFTSSGTFTA